MTQAADQTGQQEGLVGEASARVQEAASVAQEKASELRTQGSVRVREQLERRSNQAGSQARSLAEALRRSGEQLRNEENSGAAQMTDQAAERIERLGSYLEQKSGDELMRDIENFARRRPWMLAGVGLLAGLAAARFMKASSEQRYGSNGQTREQGPMRSGVRSSWSSADAERQAEIPASVGAPAHGGEGVLDADAPLVAGDDPSMRDRYESTR